VPLASESSIPSIKHRGEPLALTRMSALPFPKFDSTLPSRKTHSRAPDPEWVKLTVYCVKKGCDMVTSKWHCPQQSSWRIFARTFPTPELS